MSKDSKSSILAIAHILRRVQSDADFAYYMLNTESLRLCFVAYAEHHGEDPEEVRKRIETEVAKRKTRARVLQLEDEVSRLEGLIDDQGGSRQQIESDREQRLARAVNAIEEQVRMAELGYELDLQKLQDALANQYARAK